MNKMELSDSELLQLFGADESDSFERKEQYKAKDIGETICAFANDLPDNKSGTIFIGQKDNRECADLSINEDSINAIAVLCSDTISPSPAIGIKIKSINGCQIIIITVHSSQRPPVRYKKNIYVRIGASTQQAREEHERNLINKQRNILNDEWFYMQRETFIPVSINDLDWLFIEREYLPAAVSAEVLEHNNRSRETQLSSLRFLTADMKLNNAAVLCFHDDPQQYLPGAYVQFVRFSSSEMDGEIVDQQEIRGSVFQQIRVVEEKFRAHNINGAIIGENKRNENSDYPFMAFSQAIRNALMHRNYESNAPVRVYWFADRIEIYNPGCAFGDVTMENFGKDSVTDYRNPLLAEALKSQGYVEKFGAGISIIKKSMKDNNNPPPHFEAHEQYALIILHRRKS